MSDQSDSNRSKAVLSVRTSDSAGREVVAVGHPASSSDPDTQIIGLATRQCGVVSRAQLLQSGISRRQIEVRLKKGWLAPLHRGVYRVGPVSAPHQREVAALLASGSGAVLSHQSAAALWQIVSPLGADAPVTVSTTRNLRGRSSGVRVYRVKRLGPEEITRFERLNITTPARTLLDLAATLPTRELERAMARAEREQLLNRRELESLLSRYPRRPGTAPLRALLQSSVEPLMTRSEAEERFIRLVEKGGLHPPQMNVSVQGFEVDAYWEREGLVVEIDGFAFHSSRPAFERDRERDALLVAAGLRVMRVTWDRLTLEPEVLLVQLAQALAVHGG